MDFNILPKPKFTNVSPRTNHKSNNSNQSNQTVNVIIPNNSINNNDEPSVSIQSRDVKLEEPANEVVENKDDAVSTINFLRLVLQSYINNPIKYNNYVICTVPVLEQLIEVLSGCDDCTIEVPDLEIGCCGAVPTKIVPVTKIWVRNADSSEIFKYKYSNLLHIFEEYRISLKFIYQDN